MTKTDDEQKNTQRYISQSALDLIFLNAYIQEYEARRLTKTRFTEICREAGMISPSILDEEKEEIRHSKTKTVYDKMYIKLVKEKQPEKATVTEISEDKKKAEITNLVDDKEEVI
jgi:hypothetical protein